MANFETHEEYNQWCRDMVLKIYYSNIAMNNEGIRDVVGEISSKLHVSEGQYLIGEDE